MIVRTHYEVGQSALTLIVDESYLPVAKDAVHEARGIIESRIFEDPFFGITFDPCPVSENDHPLIQRMCQSSVLAGVGPMAGVAGAVATHVVESVVERGCTHVIAENGGDIAMRTDRTVRIGVFAAEEGLRDLAFTIPPTGRIVGICSSSGRVGPSVSLGSSGICTVFSDDPVLADCCATAFGNMVSEGTSDEMAAASESILSIDGVDGCICVCNGLVSACGSIPELSEAPYDDDMLTTVRF